MREYDVIVIGGGPSGVTAAVAAVKNGSKTLLIEKEGYLGGMATSASVPAFGPFTDGKTALIGGIGRVILEELKKISFHSPFFDHKPDRIEGIDWFPIDAEGLKLVLDRLVMKNGCDLLLHSYVTGVQVENGVIQALETSCCGIREIIKAAYFIDCTGNADVAAMAGADWEYGDENGKVQAPTLCFKIANFDTARFMKYANQTGENGNLQIACERAIKDGAFPTGEKHVAGIALMADGMAGFNFGHVYEVDSLSATDLTRAEQESRSRLPELMAFIRKYIPGAEQAVLAGSGPNIGVRESRRVVGEYRLNLQDYENRQDHPDSIAYYHYPIDLHAASPAEIEKSHRLYQQSRYQQGEAYGIPYRSLLPRGLENILVAGRTISCDRSVMASVRIMCPCFATGQAAGTAAALCVDSGLSLRQLDMNRLKTTLMDQGAYLKNC